MSMRIVDDEGKFVCLEDDDNKFMRLACPKIAACAKLYGEQSRDYLWYEMVPRGWVVTEAEPLEAKYQELLKERQGAMQ